MENHIEVVYSNSMKINRGNYEQESPFYSAKTVIGIANPKADIEMLYRDCYAQLQGIVDPLLMADYDKKRTDLENVRIRTKDGKKYPSVTSIMKPDGLFKGIKNLDAYIERGNQLDFIFKAFITQREVIEPQPEKFKPLAWEWDLPAYFLEHKLDKMKAAQVTLDVPVFNEEHMYSGEIDVLCNNQVWDIKSGQFDFTQLVAYAKCLSECNDLGIFDLKKNKVHRKTVDDCKLLWEKFLVKRGEFKSRFGI